MVIIEIKIITAKKLIEITAALFFFKRRHESCKKLKDGVAIRSLSLELKCLEAETHLPEYL